MEAVGVRVRAGVGWVRQCKGQIQKTKREPFSERETEPSREMGTVADKWDGRRTWGEPARARGQLRLLFLL